ncbi:DUF4097 family beta strand repeat-containing protein [Thermoactinospora rubra]|uniref:DUF4097 family beta strand repeat-containing protein n=1 Tax=Thermoactinospora rubra TaxID=1088767 RepID=UPI000A10A025|nr:DUF4097 family beta strand repeat-containing protein [Thermoactinospora rubra]
MKKLVIAGALVSGALLTGCGVVDSIGGPTHQEENSYDVRDEVTKIQLRSDAGDVVITESDRSGIRVTETLHWRDDKPKPEHRVDGGVLELSYDCNKVLNSCGVDYRIEVPKGLAMDLETGAGDMTLRALSGEVGVRSGAGDITAEGLTGKRLTANSGAGSVKLAYSAVPDNVSVETGAGDATVTLPKESYDVQVTTGVGDDEIAVQDDPGSPRKIKVETGAGDARVLARG